MKTSVTTHWQLGNTGFRSPSRLWALARVLHSLPVAIYGPKGELQVDAIKAALNDAKARDPESNKGLNRLGENKDLSGLTKGLRALIDAGFLSPHAGATGDALFTPLGLRFVTAKSDRAQRLVFTEALAQQGQVEVRGTQGNMLQRMAGIWVELIERVPPKEAFLHRDEMLWCVMPTAFDRPASQVVDDILAERAARHSRRYPRAERHVVRVAREKARLAQMGMGISVATMHEYADTTLRHLLLTGLFHPDSSIVNLRPDAFWTPVWRAIAAGQTELWSDTTLVDPLRVALQEATGRTAARLPTLLDLLESRDQQALASHMKDPKIGPIAGAILEGLSHNPAKCSVQWLNDEVFPIGDLGVGVACSEWAATAVLVQALSRSGEVNPQEGWKGRADAQGRPERHAPGNHADAWVTGRCRWVIEATLLSSSRQEACESESVRRHVANHLDCGKPVWGIFVAPDIDFNTLHTFAGGLYFEAGQAREVRVVPLDFTQMAKMNAADLDERGWEAFAEAIWAARPRNQPPEEIPTLWARAIEEVVEEHSRPQAPVRPRKHG